ncbi:hypothetical protein PF005_g2959 [Phytophthora fragariae]|uniref:Uncharacterized protein n=1 Tax=Phytophthora fragariae TaxID=53985 RepID=A0A6A3TCI1_9STRA|nr:hypothetical protein PF003_g14470 [Phytophthora fragariae]KAE9133921.1 hypothetical protein PF010_g2617 [Phytophthora fragariae]KAE9134281.1 hypothetical protein PF007_g2979 [Phytophthora fragariae]KAE9231755.1 hypothetical protein PF005_g2959 [Phytophthora fragariae]KAE9251434.1 hypothetical protein PF004_g2484 [Phytophthora fragariae]
MAAHTTFSFFKPGLLATEGYCYGRASLPHDAAPANSINVDRVSSGRWRDLSDAAFPLPSSDVALRTVSEAEAASGIGTYVGSCVCIARASHNRGPSWDYGAVSGYSWDPNTSSGVLHVSFESGVEPVQYRHTEIQHLASMPYALRPCIGRLVCDLMTAEMEHLHDSAHNHFRGVRTRATRRSKTILDKLHAPLIDETKAVPLFDSSTGSIREVTTKYLLDFMYYKEGGRRTPRNLVLGDSVFDEPMSRVNVTANPETESSAVGTPLVPLVDHDLLSDSDDDDDPVVAPPMAIAAAETTRVQPPTVPRSSRKRAREVPDDASDDIDSLVALRETYTRNPTMIRNIDRLISMSQTPGDERSFQSLSAPTTDSQAQFRPTAMQRQIHRHLVNGTYACMSAQLLLETLQFSLQTLDLLPHPAVIRAFFS